MSVYKGWNAEIRYADTEADLDTASAITGVQSIDGPNFTRDTDEVHSLGNAFPYGIADGTAKISFNIERAVDTSDDLTTFYNLWVNGTEKYWGIYPQGYGAGKPKIIIVGKISKWSMGGLKPGNTVTETFDIVGKTPTIGTI